MSGPVQEINFDGLVGPTHNYAGLAPGNIASAINSGDVSHPREAALQGLAKMRLLMDLGLAQGFFTPPRRPATAILRQLGFSGTDRDVLKEASEHEPLLFVQSCSASAMWAANAATVLAAPDTADGKVHLVCANLATLAHRAMEAGDSFRLLGRIFPNRDHFTVHPPLPLSRHVNDEGAANHMRIAARHDAPGLNLFVHGEEGRTGFPVRQSLLASRAIARLASLATDGTRYIRQASRAIQAGAFHNDVVAVANEHVLFAHADAFEDKAAVFEGILRALPDAEIIEVDAISLEEAVTTYLFNSQLVTLPDGQMALILPEEARENAKVWNEVQRVLAANNAIGRAIVVNLRESMRNGGGPACLRLRVPVSEQARAAIDQRYLLDDRRWEKLVALVERHWPERIAPADLATPDFWQTSAAAHDALETFMAGEAG